jgi:hypothetical protein
MSLRGAAPWRHNLLVNKRLLRGVEATHNPGKRSRGNDIE